MNVPSGVKKWLAFGSGVGIQIAGPREAESLRIAAVRVRPGGARVAGGFTIEDFAHQPAGVWGTDFAAFLRKLGMRQSVVTVVLPRRDVIVRTLALPGVADKDLSGAIGFQMDSIHPYNEADVVSNWVRIPGTSHVLVAVTRRDTIGRYLTMFAEAGIRVGGFTCSAAAIYSAQRVFGAGPAAEILAFQPGDEGVEIYGESPARPLYSASFDVEPERASALAAAELRLENAPGSKPLSELLGADPALPFAAALTAACPLLSLPLNLLPVEQRQTRSPLRWVPSAALSAITVALAGLLAAFSGYQNRQYQRRLESQIAQVQPAANRAVTLDKEVDAVRKRTLLLDDLRRRPKADMDVLAELTKILPASAWLNLVEISGRQVQLAGEAEQAAPLLKLIDSSPLFESSDFNSPPLRISNGEGFRIRTNRQGAQP